MPQEQGGVNVAAKECIASPVYLSLSERAAPRLAPARLLEEAKQQWMQAFHKCFLFTLRSLSFPCHAGDVGHHDNEGQIAEAILYISASDCRWN